MKLAAQLQVAGKRSRPVARPGRETVTASRYHSCEDPMPVARLLDLERSEVASFCRRWKVRELAAFGSVLREDFRTESDVDLLVTFEPDANWGLLDQATMENELTELLGRKVDLVSRRAVEQSTNWIRRKAILESAEIVHVAR